MGEGRNGGLRVHFDARVRVEFQGAKVTSDAGLLAVRELDDALRLSQLAERMLTEMRTGRNIQHELVALLRPGHVHSAHDWKELLEPVVVRYRDSGLRKYLRADAAFASPEGLVGPSSAHIGEDLEAFIAAAAGNQPRNRGIATPRKEKLVDMGDPDFILFAARLWSQRLPRRDARRAGGARSLYTGCQTA